MQNFIASEVGVYLDRQAQSCKISQPQRQVSIQIDTSQEVSITNRLLLYSNLIGQNVTTMVLKHCSSDSEVNDNYQHLGHFCAFVLQRKKCHTSLTPVIQPLHNVQWTCQLGYQSVNLNYATKLHCVFVWEDNGISAGLEDVTWYMQHLLKLSTHTKETCTDTGGSAELLPYPASMSPCVQILVSCATPPNKRERGVW